MSLENKENNQQHDYYEHESGDDHQLQSQEDDTGRRSVQSDQDSLSPEINSRLDSTNHGRYQLQHHLQQISSQVGL